MLESSPNPVGHSAGGDYALHLKDVTNPFWHKQLSFFHQHLNESFSWGVDPDWRTWPAMHCNIFIYIVVIFIFWEPSLFPLIINVTKFSLAHLMFGNLWFTAFWHTWCSQLPCKFSSLGINSHFVNKSWKYFSYYLYQRDKFLYFLINIGFSNKLFVKIKFKSIWATTVRKNFACGGTGPYLAIKHKWLQWNMLLSSLFVFILWIFIHQLVNANNCVFLRDIKIFKNIALLS